MAGPPSPRPPRRALLAFPALPLITPAVINGVLIGSVDGLAALGLTLVWGIMDIVNMAHGEFILLGAYLTFVLYNLPGGIGGVSPILALLVAIPAGALVG